MSEHRTQNTRFVGPQLKVPPWSTGSRGFILETCAEGTYAESARVDRGGEAKKVGGAGRRTRFGRELIGRGASVWTAKRSSPAYWRSQGGSVPPRKRTTLRGVAYTCQHGGCCFSLMDGASPILRSLGRTLEEARQARFGGEPGEAFTRLPHAAVREEFPDRARPCRLLATSTERKVEREESGSISEIHCASPLEPPERNRAAL